MPAVFLGLDPTTCTHTYPCTRDGRCHGCGARHPEAKLAELRTYAHELRYRALDPHWHELSNERQTAEAAAGAIAAWLENTSNVLHKLAQAIADTDTTYLSGKATFAQGELRLELLRMAHETLELAAGFQGRLSA